MEKSKKEQMMLLVLIPVFLAVFLYMRYQQGSGAGAAKPATAALSGPSAIASLKKAEGVMQVEYQPAARDPFIDLFEAYVITLEGERPGEEIVPLPSLKIQGLVWNSDVPQAIVNEQVVKIGDTIEGVKVVKIEKTGITVSHAGREVLVSK